MKPPPHAIVIEPWRKLGFGNRVARDVIGMVVRPLSLDSRMSVLISALAEHIYEVADTEDQIDAVMDVLRMAMKMHLPKPARRE